MKVLLWILNQRSFFHFNDSRIFVLILRLSHIVFQLVGFTTSKFSNFKLIHRLIFDRYFVIHIIFIWFLSCSAWNFMMKSFLFNFFHQGKSRALVSLKKEKAMQCKHCSSRADRRLKKARSIQRGRRRHPPPPPPWGPPPEAAPPWGPPPPPPSPSPCPLWCSCKNRRHPSSLTF